MATTTTTAPKPLLADLASTMKHVPSNFIRPPSDRPNLQDQSSNADSIPIIDLQGLDGSNRSQIIQNIAQACKNYGFFQVYTNQIQPFIIINIIIYNDYTLHKI